LVFGVLAILVARVLARRFIWIMRAQNRMLTTVFIIGSKAENRALESTLAGGGLSGFRLVGTLDLSMRSLSEAKNLATVVEEIRNSKTDPDLVVLSNPKLVSPQAMEELASRLELVPVAFAVVATSAGLATARLRFQSETATPLLRVSDIHLGSLQRAFKRLLDLLLSSSALVVLAPFLLFFAVLIKIDSPGPAFFKQLRVGQFGRSFVIIKFRTMFDDAEARQGELKNRKTDAGNRVLFKLKEDPRVTRVGRLLRKWSLDELPQLFNVFWGHMSLVGPRPPLASEVKDYEGAAYRRLAAKPGLTGLWQVSGRSDLSWEESVRLDLHYVENWSPLLDFVVLLKTIPAVLGRRGAY
jgi:exopolysaccharide biosynthesis polyprenyl glycosylphosphotransferase